MGMARLYAAQGASWWLCLLGFIGHWFLGHTRRGLRMCVTELDRSSSCVYRSLVAMLHGVCPLEWVYYVRADEDDAPTLLFSLRKEQLQDLSRRRVCWCGCLAFA